MEVVRDGELRSGNRVYSTPGDRRRAIAGLRREGFNHFTCYADKAGPVALMFGRADWVTAGSAYVNW